MLHKNIRKPKIDISLLHSTADLRTSWEKKDKMNKKMIFTVYTDLSFGHSQVCNYNLLAKHFRESVPCLICFWFTYCGTIFCKAPMKR